LYANANDGGTFGTLNVSANGAGATAYVQFSGYAALDTGVSFDDPTDDRALGGKLGNLNLVAGADATATAYLYTYGTEVNGNNAGGGIGNVSVNAIGDFSHASVQASGYQGANIGNITANANGFSAYAHVQASTSDGNIGTIVMTANGSYAATYLEASAGAGTASDGSQYGGRIGQVSLTSLGDAAKAEGQLSATGTDSVIGAVNLVANGRNARSSIDVSLDNGAEIASVTGNATGNEAGTYISVDAYASDVGNVTLVANGTGAYANADLQAQVGYVDEVATGGQIGTVVVNITGNFAAANLWTNVSGTISDTGEIIAANTGSVVMNANGMGAELSLDANANQGDVGNIIANANGLDTYTDLSAYAYGGDIGSIVANVTGINTDAWLEAFANSQVITTTSGDTSTSSVVGGDILCEHHQLQLVL